MLSRPAPLYRTTHRLQRPTDRPQMAHKLKCDKDGHISWRKSQLVAKGFSEIRRRTRPTRTPCLFVRYPRPCRRRNQKDWSSDQIDISNAYLPQRATTTAVHGAAPGSNNDEHGESRSADCRGLYGTKSGGYHWYRPHCS